MAVEILSAERLRELLSYDPETGKFFHRASRGGARAGSEAGYERADGYRHIGVDGRLHLAHRLAWVHVYGDSPAGDIDHINGSRADNRIANLRDVTRTVNLQNLRRARRNNATSGMLGVSKSLGRWRAQIKVDGRQKCLGRFATPEEAHAAYLEAKRRLHPGCTI